MINWMLEVEDVEDVACTVDDMEAKGLSGYFASEGMERGRGDKERCPRCKAMETPTVAVATAFGHGFTLITSPESKKRCTVRVLDHSLCRSSGRWKEGRRGSEASHGHRTRAITRSRALHGLGQLTACKADYSTYK